MRKIWTVLFVFTPIIVFGGLRKYSVEKSPLSIDIEATEGFWDFSRQSSLADGVGAYGDRYRPTPAPRIQRRQPRLYGGKERERFQGMNDYDFHARRYNSATTLWNAPDPLAAKYSNLSPYVYCAANPILYIDPTGQRVVTMIDDVEYEYRDGDGGYGFYDSEGQIYNGGNIIAECVTEDLAKIGTGPFGFNALQALIDCNEEVYINYQTEDNSYNTNRNTINYNPFNIDTKTTIFGISGKGILAERAFYRFSTRIRARLR